MDGNTLKMKTTSPVYAIKMKRQCFQLFLNQSRTLFLRNRFVRARAQLRTQVKLRGMKLICLGLDFYLTIFLFPPTPLKRYCSAMYKNYQEQIIQKVLEKKKIGSTLSFRSWLRAF